MAIEQSDATAALYPDAGPLTPPFQKLQLGEAKTATRSQQLHRGRAESHLYLRCGSTGTGTAMPSRIGSIASASSYTEKRISAVFPALTACMEED